MTFAPAFGSPFTAGFGPVESVVADFDGDGRPDLAVARSGNDQVSVLLGTAGGNFEDGPVAPSVPGGTGITALVTADFDGDGRPDLAAGNHGGTITTLLGNGRGGFAVGGTGATAPNAVVDAAVGRFDAGPTPDVAVTIGNAMVFMLLGDGDGGFTAGAGGFTSGFCLCVPNELAAADFDEDGDLDVVTSSTNSSNVAFLMGDGAGGFSFDPETDMAGTGASTSGIDGGDVDGDSHPDVVVGHAAAPASVIWGNGAAEGVGTVTNLPAGTTDDRNVAITDVDADLRPDVVTTSADGLTLVRNDGGRAFAALGDAAGFDASDDVVAADFDGDGSNDVASVDSAGGLVTVLLNTSPAAQSAGPALSFGTVPAQTLSPPRSVSVASTGDAPLAVRSAGVAGAGAADFLIVGDRCSGVRVPPGGSCDVVVRFAPSSAGATTAALSIVSNAGIATVSLDGSGGALPQGPAGGDGANGSQGPAGPRGPDGATGPAGANGADAKVTCTVRKAKRAKKVTVTCKVTRAGVARLTRNGRVVATRRVRRGRVSFRVRRASGRYRLVMRA